MKPESYKGIARCYDTALTNLLEEIFKNNKELVARKLEVYGDLADDIEQYFNHPEIKAECGDLLKNDMGDG